MNGFLTQTRGTAAIQTVAVAPIIALLFAFVADQFWVYVPAQMRQLDSRALAWGQLRDAWGEAKQGVYGQASKSTQSTGAMDVIKKSKTPLLSQVAGFMKPLVDKIANFPGNADKKLGLTSLVWDEHTTKLKSEWNRTLHFMGKIKSEFSTTIVIDPGLGPKKAPSLWDLGYPG